ncbi:MAG: TfoX/Sxy family protein [Yoonia sp.]|uniref:TfoX/Sxy family protein n=1 Tax=Yoonia sp. TaxID=2212373 RepID=UPI00273E9008|nr:TfoX/Sxy family protein [Yoonia sp.]MDP5085337.1 TfoX/Sxy family protein [Yoonia sp.]MDP5362522.1 TfoX/Sxy family protein [Paracoccaceae bacterium]
MSASDADIAFATDLFADLGHLTTRKMFGGLCLYHQGVVFALLNSDGRIYLKAKGALAGALQSDGSEQFHNMPYWSLPMSALDDPEEACTLARRTLATL